MAVSAIGCQRGPFDTWVAAATNSRSFLRGWGANHGSSSKLERASLTEAIAALDSQADARPFSKAECATRYDLENQLLAILREQEECWRRRGVVKWVTKGDTNTRYFHAYANGHKSKCSIPRLQSEQELLLSQNAIAAHAYDFLIGLLGMANEKQVFLRNDLWDQSQRVSTQENDSLALSFLHEEIDKALWSIKVDTAPS
ncbi:Peroxidase [Hordeum vulgare]|nr:Peroxidase [Hordeum vulgare]